MSNLQEKISLVWSKNRETVFRRVEENEEYLSQMAILNAKQKSLFEQLTPAQRKQVIECSEEKLLADTVAAQDVYCAGFIEGMKTMMDIINVCKYA